MVRSCAVLFAACLSCCLAPQLRADPAPVPAKETEKSDQQLRDWIDQLGDSQYANRERAQDELRRAGTAAFDLLIAAQDHADVEIAQRARYLVRSIAIPWTSDGDPPQVRSLLANFSALNRNERKTRTQHLATLDRQIGVPPLCRVVRFEPDRILSKQAALLIMSLDVPPEAAPRKELADMIRQHVHTSTRPAIEWLNTYAAELEQPSSTLADWNRITDGELAALAKTPQKSDREIVRDLLRWHAQLLLRHDRSQEALARFRRTYELLDDTVLEIHEAMDWSIANKLYAAPPELAARFATRVNTEPQLLYRLAEAQLKGGDADAAKATAQAALQLKPGRHDDHLATAMLLYQRGLIDWSVDEYEHILKQVKLDTENGIEARITLAEMLFDVGREREGADTLKPLVDFMLGEGKDHEVAQIVKTMYLGNMHYWYAVDFAKRKEREKQIEQLKLAIAAHPTNIDILIAMYRVPDPDEDWKKDVQRRIDAHLGKCRTTINQYEEGLKRQPNMEAAIGSRLATTYNDLAWLISNTTGDFQEAVRASERSLELDSDNAAYLDTLARCYFAAGELEKAVQTQRRALKIMPHLHVMQRQLQQFEAALSAARR